MISNSDLGDLGFGWKSFKKVGKAAFKVASMPVTLAVKAANATSNVLCKGGGVQGDTKDAKTAQAFCRAVKIKDAVATRKLLPAATALAARGAQAAKVQATYGVIARNYGVNQDGTSGPDVDLLAALDGADQDSLAFALSGVDPGEIGAAITTNELIGMAPALIAVAAGAWMLARG